MRLVRLLRLFGVLGGVERFPVEFLEHAHLGEERVDLLRTRRS
jgi:hypothetical protein